MLNQIRLTVLVLLCTPFFVATSCNEGATGNAEDEIDTLASKVEERVDDLQEGYQAYRDENFIDDAYEMNREVLHLLALAQQKGTNAQLRETAKKIEADHKQLDNTIRQYASTNSIAIDADGEPDTGLEQKDAGNDWDNAWADKIVREHEQLIRKFENARDKTLSAELKNIATNSLPALENHKNTAESLKATL